MNIRGNEKIKIKKASERRKQQLFIIEGKKLSCLCSFRAKDRAWEAFHPKFPDYSD